MRNYKLVPEDILFFRDGKPFAQIQKSMFPPAPTTVYGALQALLLYDWYDSTGQTGNILGIIKKDTDGPPSYHALQIKGPWLASSSNDLFPCPLDILLKTEIKDSKVVVESTCYGQIPEESESQLMSDKYCGLSCSHKDYKQPEGWWLDGDGIYAWLKGEEPQPESFFRSGALWDFESRVGIRILAESGKVEEGALFGVDYVRPTKESGLSIRVVSSEALPSNGIIRLGGEGRTVCVKELNGTSDLPKSPIDQGTKKIKIALITPAIFEHAKGIYPANFDVDSGMFTHGEVKLKLATIAGGGYVAIGGWDGTRLDGKIAQGGAPKAIRRAVRPGTVYYCEVVSGNPESLIGVQFTDNLDDAKMGFGTTLIGVWK